VVGFDEDLDCSRALSYRARPLTTIFLLITSIASLVQVYAILEILQTSGPHYSSYPGLVPIDFRFFVEI
jgi:hypothetical protein